MGYEEWGVPLLADLDGDGTSEIAAQFQGLHLHGPDLTVYRWHENILERSQSVTDLLTLPHSLMNSAVLSKSEEGYFVHINAEIDLDDNVMQQVSGDYAYESGRLIRIQ